MQTEALRSPKRALRWATKGSAVALVVTACSVIAVSQPATSAPKHKTISVGVLIDRTGPAPEGTLWDGVQGYFRNANAHGGINGYKVNVVAFDTAGSPATNAADTTELIQQSHVPVIIDDDGEGGTAAVPIASAAGIPLVGNDVQPDVFHNPDVFPNTSDVANFGGLMTAKVFKARGVTKVAIIALNVPEAIEAAAGDAKYVQANGMQLVTNIVFPLTQTDFTGYASKIIAAGADGIECVSSESGSLALISALKQQGWAGKAYYFPSLQPGLAAATGSFGDGRVVAPNALLVLPANRTVLKVMKTYFDMPATTAVTNNLDEGWTDAEIVAHAITLLGSKSPTAAHVKAALQSFKNWSGTFTPPLTYGRGAHLDPAHCGQIVEQMNGHFIQYNHQRTVCWKGSVAPS